MRPDDLELASILESLLYYYQTGDPKVKSFLRKVRVDSTINEFGFPFIRSDLVNLETGKCFFNRWEHRGTDIRKYNSEYLLGSNFCSLVEISNTLESNVWISNRASWIHGDQKQTLINSISIFLLNNNMIFLADLFLDEVASWLYERLKRAKYLDGDIFLSILLLIV